MGPRGEQEPRILALCQTRHPGSGGVRKDGVPRMMAQTLQLSVGNGASPSLPPTASFSPSVSLPGRPQASRCAQPRGWFWLPPSLSPSLQHCILHRGKDHLSRSLQPSVCTREPGSKKQPRALPASFPSCFRLASPPGYPEPLPYCTPASDWSECSILPPHCPSPSSCGLSGLESFLSLPTWCYNSRGQQAFLVCTLLCSLPALMFQYPLQSVS